MYISKLILDSYNYTPIAFVTMHAWLDLN